MTDGPSTKSSAGVSRDRSQITWIIDSQFDALTRAALPPGCLTTSDAAHLAGHNVVLLDNLGRAVNHAGEPTAIPPAGACVVTHGPHPFVARLKRDRQGGWTPGFYHRVDQLGYQVFAAHLGDLLLNDDFVLLPWAEIVRRRPAAFGSDAIFIRPDAVTKQFTGFVVTEAEFDHEINARSQTTRPDPDLLCVVARPRQILSEWRFVIADRAVVAQSEYRWDDAPLRVESPEACLDLACRVARREWQPDRVYVCDAALTSIQGVEQARLVELNTFSCAGLYACDASAVVKAVSRAALAEFIGEDS